VLERVSAVGVSASYPGAALVVSLDQSKLILPEDSWTWHYLLACIAFWRDLQRQCAVGLQVEPGAALYRICRRVHSLALVAVTLQLWSGPLRLVMPSAVINDVCPSVHLCFPKQPVTSSPVALRSTFKLAGIVARLVC